LDTASATFQHPPTETRRPTLAQTSARAAPGCALAKTSKPVTTANAVRMAAAQKRQFIFELLYAAIELSWPSNGPRTEVYRHRLPLRRRFVWLGKLPTRPGPLSCLRTTRWLFSAILGRGGERGNDCAARLWPSALEAVSSVVLPKWSVGFAYRFRVGNRTGYGFWDT
jgi:hypothetical protein